MPGSLAAACRVINTPGERAGNGQTVGDSEDGVGQIQDAVNLYYGQFEEQPAAEAAEPEPESVPVETEAAVETDETPLEPANAEAETPVQSGNIDDAGSPHNQSEGTGSQEHPEE